MTVLRTCTKCSTEKPQSEFYANRSVVSGFDSHCKECRRAKRRENWATDHNGSKTREQQRLAARTPEQIAERKQYSFEHRLWHYYKMTRPQFDQLMAEQRGVCALCGQAEAKVHHKSNEIMRLAIDHDHLCCPGTKTCGQCVRGLLCYDCNLIIGKAEPKPALRERFADYLGRRPLSE